MSPVVIREARPDEWQVVADLRRDFVAEVRGISIEELPTGFIDANATHIEEAMRRGDYVSFLAEEAGTLVGGVSLVFGRLPPLPGDDRELEAWVIAMWVDERVRRQGIGARLLGQAEDHAVVAGARRLLLWATPDGDPLYRRVGFSSPGDLMFKPLD